MNEIKFVSFLDEIYLRKLENLLFFNQNQKKVVSGILESIRIYGLPEIVNQNGILRIKIGNLINIQTLFAIDTFNNNELAGVAIYFRKSDEEILLLHLSINDEYSFTGKRAGYYLVFQIIDKIKNSLKLMKNVKFLTIIYNNIKTKHIKIN